MTLPSWLSELAELPLGEILGGMFLLSLLLAVVSLVVLPVVVVSLPEDYFKTPRAPLKTRLRLADPKTATWLVVKNLGGLGILIAGIVMLFTPGQGLLSILIASILIDYPGKFKVERYLVSRGGVLRAINWARRRRGRPPLAL